MSQKTTIRWHAILAAVALLTGSGAWVIGTVAIIAAGAPPLDRSKLLLTQNIEILDRSGKLLYRFFQDENRSSLSVQSVPPLVQNAIVAIEDKRFFQRRSCIDVQAWGRAFFHNLSSDDVQGGSTITQQLVRNLFLTPDRTVVRKIQEAWLACRLEHTLTKEEILTLYINRIGFGGTAYGIEQAAQMYFGVKAGELTLPQIAVLAALPQQPSSFMPGGSHERTTVDHKVVTDVRDGKLDARDIPTKSLQIGLLPRQLKTPKGQVFVPGRADVVLKAMQDFGAIRKETALQAHTELETIQLHPSGHPLTAPHFALWMRRETENLLSQVENPDLFRTTGLTIRTTLDQNMQRIAEETITEFEPLMETQGARDVALVAMDRKTRQILAYVGNVATDRNTQTSDIDMAQVPRQPGSSFKPLLYALAFMRGFTPDSYVFDTALTIGNVTPKNYEGGFKGRLTIRQALAMSRNIPAIRTFLAINDEDGLLRFIANAGAPTALATKEEALKSDPHFTYGWPLAIGSAEIPLLEMTNAYATMGSKGEELPVTAICHITDRQNHPVAPLPPKDSVQAIDTNAAQEVDSILRDSSVRPQGFWRDMLTIPGLKNAAKTGTSNLCLQRSYYGDCLQYGVGNVWTLGYTDRIAVGVWVGNADGRSLNVTADGLTVAAPIWRTFLDKTRNISTAPLACS